MSNQGKTYDMMAKKFAEMRQDFIAEPKYLDIVITYLNENSHILDVGCGSGIPIASYLIEKNFKVTGIDGSQELLNIAKMKCPKMMGIYGDIRTINLEEKFDAQELYFYSLAPNIYEQHLKKYGFEILLKEREQEHHLVWIAKKLINSK